MTKSIRIYDKEYDSILKYPFKSKYKYVDLQQPVKAEPFIPDFKLKSCKKLSKPNFSNEPGCWEADLMFVNYYVQENGLAVKTKKIYLIMLNVNTRYLIVEPIKDKGKIWYALEQIIKNNPKFEFRVIKCDGEPGFLELKDECIIVRFSTGETQLIFDINQTIKEQNKYYKSMQDIARRSILVEHDIISLRDLLRYSDFYKPRIKNLFNFQQMVREELRKEYPQGIPQYLPKKAYEGQVYDRIINSITDFYPIKFVINSSPYALAHKNVDAVIRTLRNAFGLDDRRLGDYNLMRQMVNFYNNTPHSSLRFKNYYYIDTDTYSNSGVIPPTKYVYYTPAQVQNNVDLEWRYIRMMRLKLRDINDKQKAKSLLSYKNGNIILVHIDKSKTQKKHEKRRRVFNEIAEFIRYQNGNVLCKLLVPYQTFALLKSPAEPFTKDAEKLKPYKPSDKGRVAQTDAEKAVIEVPIIYTKFICKSINELNNDFRNYFNVF